MVRRGSAVLRVVNTSALQDPTARGYHIHVLHSRIPENCATLWCTHSWDKPELSTIMLDYVYDLYEHLAGKRFKLFYLFKCRCLSPPTSTLCFFLNWQHRFGMVWEFSSPCCAA